MKCKFYFVRVLVLLCLVTILGCSATTKRAYKGPELSNDKIARVLISANVNLVSLDGKSYPRGSLQMTNFYFIDILPGAHTIKILPIPQQFGQGNVTGQVFTIDFTADAGNTYQTMFVLYNIKHGHKSVSYQSNAWIQNRTRYNRALSYYNKRKYEKAISVCDKSLDNSYCPFTHILRGCCYHEVKKYEKAISDFNESIKISPELFRVYENRGMAYFKLGNYSQALSDYTTAMNFRPENLDRPNIPYAKYDDKSKETLFRLFMLRADAYLHMGNTEKAYLDLKQAADLSNMEGTLNFSLQHNQPEIAKHLINSGADVNAKSSGDWTPLMFALRYNQPDNAKKLINRGADVNAKNSGGWTPLMIALRNNQPDNAKELINRGADVNAKASDGWTPLMIALRYNQPDNAKELINRGADVNAKNSGGWTPLMLASRYNEYPETNALEYKEIISILKKAGAK